MVNVGFTSSVHEFALDVDALDPSDGDIVASMRIPHDVPLESLVLAEMRALRSVLGAWGANGSFDATELFLRNTACKRVLYVSAPIFLPDTLPLPYFVSRGVNTRVHVFATDDPQDTIRLEAISSYAVGTFRFRYALSIQYVHDSVGRGWQLIRPVVVLDRRLMAHRGPELSRLLKALERLILFGSHDYVHGTVLNWFPPLRDLEPAYGAITSERVHPPDIDAWHAGSQDAIPDDLVPGVRTPGIAILELYSLLVHADVISRLWDEDAGLARDVDRLTAELRHALDEFVAVCDLDEAETTDAVDYFMMVAGWFLASALPLGSARLAEKLADFPGDWVERLTARLAETTEGMFDFVGYVEPTRFPWCGREVALDQITDEYARALQRPALQEHLDHLLTPSEHVPTPATCWVRALAAGLSPGDADRLVTGLERLRAMLADDLGAALRAFDESGTRALLRSVVEAGGGDRSDRADYARAIAASALAIADRHAADQRVGAA